MGKVHVCMQAYHKTNLLKLWSCEHYANKKPHYRQQSSFYLAKTMYPKKPEYWYTMYESNNGEDYQNAPNFHNICASWANWKS